MITESLFKTPIDIPYNVSTVGDFIEHVLDNGFYGGYISITNDLWDVHKFGLPSIGYKQRRHRCAVIGGTFSDDILKSKVSNVFKEKLYRFTNYVLVIKS